ncbi:hypothetical protein HELRODRAFT_158207 [Helobdella robusta]|uniref:sn-1-specific diacylglycerol lipase ABHD11 n=1 Tax=Helobdella robusta TaxID=6412 RepID=T1EMK6_HELRO|nr:hypothetical protein HELRODRAFT_158207 [Helobdella robusta]ESO10325.1 hypothetical protein HELRODRAFT_158207 [Helobdella robusta]
MLIIHGLFGSKKNFDSLAKVFSNKAALQASYMIVISIDSRNHGDSGHNNNMTYPAMSDDVIKLLDDLKLSGGVVVMGHSMGGKIAMTMALNNPSMLSGLIVVDMVPGRSVTADTDFFPKMLQKMREINFDATPDISIVQARKEANKQLSTAVQDARIRDFLLTNLVVKDGRVTWRLNLQSIHDHYQDLMTFQEFQGRTYNGRTLFIGGSLSSMLSEKHHPMIKQFFPSAEIIKLSGAGHWVHADDPYNFASKVIQFVKTLIFHKRQGPDF